MHFVYSSASFLISWLTYKANLCFACRLSPSQLAHVHSTIETLSQQLQAFIQQDDADSYLHDLKGKIKILREDTTGWKGLFHYFFHYAYYQRASQAVLSFSSLLEDLEFPRLLKEPSPRSSPLKAEQLVFDSPALQTNTFLCRSKESPQSISANRAEPSLFSPILKPEASFPSELEEQKTTSPLQISSPSNPIDFPNPALYPPLSVSGKPENEFLDAAHHQTLAPAPSLSKSAEKSVTFSFSTEQSAKKSTQENPTSSLEVPPPPIFTQNPAVIECEDDIPPPLPKNNLLAAMLAKKVQKGPLLPKNEESNVSPKNDRGEAKNNLALFFKNKSAHTSLKPNSSLPIPLNPKTSLSAEERHREIWESKIKAGEKKRANPQIFYDLKNPSNKPALDKEKEEKERDIKLVSSLVTPSQLEEKSVSSWLQQKKERLKQLEELLKPIPMPIRERDRVEKIFDSYLAHEMKIAIGLYFDWQPPKTDNELSKNYYETLNANSFLENIFKEQESLMSTPFAKEALLHKEEWVKYLTGGGLHRFAENLDLRAKELKPEPRHEIPPFQNKINPVKKESQDSNNSSISAPKRAAFLNDIKKIPSGDSGTYPLLVLGCALLRKHIANTPEKDSGDLNKSLDSSFN